MRLSIQEVMEKLGVDRVMASYESQPWMYGDEKLGITCSAEVRMGPSCEDLETEVQFLHEHGETIIPEPKIKKPKYKYSTDPNEYNDPYANMEPDPKKQNPVIEGREQVLIMRMLPDGDEKWSTQSLQVKGVSYRNAFHEWELKGCDLFRCIVDAMLMGEIPDIDDLAERTLCEGGRNGGGRRGRIGRKSPKVKPGALMGIKKGM